MLDRNEQLNNFIADYKHEKRGRVTIYAPTGIITYLSKHVIDKIKDIGDITLSLKTCNLERNAFYEGVEFPDDCDVLISYCHQTFFQAYCLRFLLYYLKNSSFYRRLIYGVEHV